jgi:hypothetical protein
MAGSKQKNIMNQQVIDIIGLPVPYTPPQKLAPDSHRRRGPSITCGRLKADHPRRRIPVPFANINSYARIRAGKGIDEGNAERLKIIHIAGDHGQPANQSGSRNERIFKMLIRPPVHELRPTTKNSRVG